MNLGAIASILLGAQGIYSGIKSMRPKRRSYRYRPTYYGKVRTASGRTYRQWRFYD